MESETTMELNVKVYEKVAESGESSLSRKLVKIGFTNNTPTFEDLESRLRAEVEMTNGNLEIMYCGRKLANGHPLRLRNHSFLNVVVRRKPTNPEEAIPPPTKEKAVESLTRLMRPEYRAAVEAVCSSGDKIDQIIASVPELRTDLIAQVILKDPNVIAVLVLAEPNSIERIIQKHPGLAAATVKVYDAAMKRATVLGNKSQPSTSRSYALDHMSDEEEEPAPSTSTSNRTQQSWQITANQLAQALATAAAQAARAPAATGQVGQTSQSSTPATTSQLSAALSQALGTTPDHSSSPQAQPTRSGGEGANYDSQLQQLRDMGITDDRVATQALQAAGGNVQLALEFIYGNM